jgi:hypothetical protein
MSLLINIHAADEDLTDDNVYFFADGTRQHLITMTYHEGYEANGLGL